jgi:hypothetical protein
LLKVQKLVLQCFVLSFSLSELHRLLSQLSNKPVFVVLVHVIVIKFAFWTL